MELMTWRMCAVQRYRQITSYSDQARLILCDRRNRPANSKGADVKPSLEREQKLYDALKRITKYQSAQRLLDTGEKRYGVSGEEALEMAYENIQAEANAAIKGMRRPKEPT